MPHYFDPDPATRSRPATVPLVLPDMRAELAVDRGVFSTRGVDAGTLELLRLDPPALADPCGDLLDLGCGYGPIAVTLARRYPASTVWALDVNARALELTAANTAALGVDNVRPVDPDGVPDGVTFAGIWTNPPIRIGKTALQELVARWLGRLEPGGLARLVVHRHLGGDSLAAWLRSEGFGVARLGSRKGYRLLEAWPPPGASAR